MISIICSNQNLRFFLQQVMDINNSNRVKPSLFNYVYSEDGNDYIYNVLTKTLIEIDSACFHTFFDKKNSVEISTNADFQTLREYFFLIPEECDELKLYLQLHEFFREFEDSRDGIVRYNILTTTCCNAHCFYCFEQGLPQLTMTESIARKTAAYIIKTHRHNSDIYLRWFGGEPLLNQKAMNTICTILHDEDISFYSTISSNGYLCNENMLKSKDLWNLQKVRLSMDGMSEEYNKRKNFAGNIDAFKRTIENLDMMINSGLKVTVRLTLDYDNIDSITELVYFLINRYPHNSKLSLYTKCIFSEVSDAAAQKDFNRVKKLLAKKTEIDDMIRNSGQYDFEKITLVGYRTYFCAANDPHKVTISPNGDLCSCECHCMETAYWGDVENGITNIDEYKRWQVREVREKCNECVFLPLCTPFSQCPMSDYYDCRERFAMTQRDYIREEVYRYRNGASLLKDIVLSDYDV